MSSPPLTVLVTGSTGYIGGRLVPRLLAEGHRVRAMTRTAGRLRDVPWAGQVRVVEADVLGAGRGSGEGNAQLADALDGVDVAYYLVHSIGEGLEFEETDRRAARAFGAAASKAGVARIVYLGGLIPRTRSSPRISPPARRSVSCCSTAVCPRWSFRRRSSSAAARRPSRCCAT